MKTVLIVEDEKLIRQGIKTMIQRSGVPVEVIIECANGEMALEVIREQKVDVMFTDIRMPKMDGIKLVKQMQSCAYVPLTVAISGYDDFSYAVEMLRNGVREYILKPVEREKITEILRKLDEEIMHNQEKVKQNKRLGYQQVKHLMLLERTTEEEVRTLEQQYEKGFYEGGYVVCATNCGERGEMQTDNYIYLPEVEEDDIFVVPEEKIELLLKNELKDSYVGVSGLYHGLAELRTAYLESRKMRKWAFCRNQTVVRPGEETEHIPERLIQEAERFTTDAARLQRVQLIGTERREELENVWRRFFYEVKNGRISPEQYESCMTEFFRETEKTYRNAVEKDTEALCRCREIFREDCMDRYEEQFVTWILNLQVCIGNQLDVNRNSQKIKQAVEYIEQNYASDLNMAVVSNHISMNYSLFSYSFKQYTGSNFVNYLKDIRMREAKRLLAETDMRIIEISQAVGYENEKHFMKIFKASCGVSPSEYRKNMRQD